MAMSLACDVLQLLLTVLHEWSKAARLMGRPARPALPRHSAGVRQACLADPFSALPISPPPSRCVAQGRVGSGHVLICLVATSLVDRLARDLPILLRSHGNTATFVQRQGLRLQGQLVSLRDLSVPAFLVILLCSCHFFVAPFVCNQH